jgi:hypothetical protein
MLKRKQKENSIISEPYAKEAQVYGILTIKTATEPIIDLAIAKHYVLIVMQEKLVACCQNKKIGFRFHGR